MCTYKEKTNVYKHIHIYILIYTYIRPVTDKNPVIAYRFLPLTGKMPVSANKFLPLTGKTLVKLTAVVH